LEWVKNPAHRVNRVYWEPEGACGYRTPAREQQAGYEVLADAAVLFYETLMPRVERLILDSWANGLWRSVGMVAPTEASSWRCVCTARRSETLWNPRIQTEGLGGHREGLRLILFEGTHDPKLGPEIDLLVTAEMPDSSGLPRISACCFALLEPGMQGVVVSERLIKLLHLERNEGGRYDLVLVLEGDGESRALQATAQLWAMVAGIDVKIGRDVIEKLGRLQMFESVFVFQVEADTEMFSFSRTVLS